MFTNESSEENSNPSNPVFSENDPNNKSNAKLGFNSGKLLLLILLVAILITVIYFLVPKNKAKPSKNTPTPIVLNSTIKKGNEIVLPEVFKQNKEFVYPNADLVQLTSGNTTTTLALSTKDKFDVAKSYYAKILKDGSWRVEPTKDQKDAYNVTALKGSVRFGVTVVRTFNYEEVKKDSPVRKVTEGPTSITLGVNSQ